MKRPFILTGIFCLILVFISTSMVFANGKGLDYGYKIDRENIEIYNALKDRETSRAFFVWAVKKYGRDKVIELLKYGMVSKHHKAELNKIIENAFRQFLKERGQQ